MLGRPVELSVYHRVAVVVPPHCPPTAGPEQSVRLRQRRALVQPMESRGGDAKVECCDRQIGIFKRGVHYAQFAGRVGQRAFQIASKARIGLDSDEGIGAKRKQFARRDTGAGADLEGSRARLETADISQRLIDRAGIGRPRPIIFLRIATEGAASGRSFDYLRHVDPRERVLKMPKPPASEADLKAITIGEVKKLAGKIYLADYNPDWVAHYAGEEQRLRTALGDRALRIEHTGSTSVPSLIAKPIIDVVLVVADTRDEAAYVPALEAHGYRLRIREPDWFEHRLFKGPDVDANVHVFSRGCPEIERMLAFRDWLRADPVDRERYAQAKRDLAAQDWAFTQNYADAKTKIIEEIMSRAPAGKR